MTNCSHSTVLCRASCRLRRACLVLTSLGLLIATSGAGCIPFPGPTPNPIPPDGLVAKVVITPGAALLTGPAQYIKLSTQVFAADGGSLTGYAVDWKSSDESIATLDKDGLLVATADLGSAQITATCGGVASMPIIAVIAQPAPGSALVSDNNVMEAPAPVDPNAQYGVGYRYTVKLTGMLAPAIGQILVGTGEQPIGGRVVDVQQDGGMTLVTLEVIPLNEMFATIRINQQIDLSMAAFEVPADLAESYDVQRAADGTLSFKRKPDSKGERIKRAQGTRAMGPFECETESEFDLTFSSEPDFTIDPNLVFDFQYEWPGDGFQRLVVGADPVVKLSWQVRAALQGAASYGCKGELAQFRIPVSGPLSLLFTGIVPVGVGFDLDGEFTGVEAGFDTEVELTGRTRFGVDCTGGCQFVTELTADVTKHEIKPVLPNPANLSEQFELGINLHAYGFASVAVGNPFLRKLRFEALEAKVGPKLSLTTAHPLKQANDPESASGFAFTVEGEVGAANSFALLRKSLNLTLPEFKKEFKLLEVKSPTGTFEITPAIVQPGDENNPGERATFITQFDKATFLGAQSIEGLVYYWKRNGQLIPVPSEIANDVVIPCSDVPANVGQTLFTCETAFTEEHVGEQTFHAFYKPRLFGIPLPFPIEINDDAKAMVTVGELNVTVTPSSVTLAPGETQQFTAQVTGTSNTAVTWSAEGGSIDEQGIFTAGKSPGDFAVTATSIANPSKSATATATIVAIPPAVPTFFVQSPTSVSAQVAYAYPEPPYQCTDLSQPESYYVTSFSETAYCHGTNNGASTTASASLSFDIIRSGGSIQRISIRCQGSATFVENWAADGIARAICDIRFRVDRPVGFVIESDVVQSLDVIGESCDLWESNSNQTIFYFGNTGGEQQASGVLAPGSYGVGGGCTSIVNAPPFSPGGTAKANIQIDFIELDRP